MQHYQLRRCLGEGGFGEVFEAWDSRLCRTVAIKRMKHGIARARADLLHEARMAASLQHPAFVRIHALEDDGGAPSIVMELVPGLTLKEWAAAHTPGEQAALDVVRQVADAMQEAHASGLVHGDLKPSNLIVEPSGTVRILDFGLAIQGDSQTTTSLGQCGPLGTIAYMAPERLLGAVPDRSGDIYALGVMLYELCHGTRPFSHLTGLPLAASLTQTTSQQWAYAAALSPTTVQLIQAMTATPATRRIASMAEVLRQIAQPGESARMLPALPAPGRRGWSGLSRRQWIIFGAVLALSATALGAWQWWHSSTGAAALAAPPYSGSQEMRNGFASLKDFDRPGNLERATRNFANILAQDPDNAAAVAGLALVYRFRYLSDAEDVLWLKKADASAQQALKLNPQLALSHAAQALVLDAQGKSQAALAASEQALSLDPLNFFAWHGRITALRHLRRQDEAMALAQQAMQRFPRERIFADQLGTIHFEQSHYAEAERAFRLSLQIQPDAVYAYANLFGALMRQNRSDEALQVLQQGLQIRPSARLYNNLGNALFLRGDYTGAAAAFENAVSPQKGNPADYLLWANLADTLLWIPGREQQARQAYDRARTLLAPRLEKAPQDATLASRMGLYSARAGNKSEAKALLQRALQLAPSSADVHFRAGLAYELIGNRSTALQEIARADALGYPRKFIEAEPDLIGLRRDSRYPGNKAVQ